VPPVLALKDPSTSATTSVDPLRLNAVTLPPLPRGTATRFGTVVPELQLRFDARGRGLPAGKTVRKLSEVVPVTVTFSTTAVAPVGTPPWPVTWISMLWVFPSVAPEHWFWGKSVEAARVSQMRAGLNAWYAPEPVGDGEAEALGDVEAAGDGDALGEAGAVGDDDGLGDGEALADGEPAGEGEGGGGVGSGARYRIMPASPTT
jgi:hypothetical protein